MIARIEVLPTASFLAVACLVALLVPGALPGQELSEPSTAPATGAVATTAVAPALVPVPEPELPTLLEEARKAMDQGGAGSDAAKMRFAFLSRVLRSIPPPPGAPLEELVRELGSYEERLSVLREGTTTGAVPPGAIETLAARITGIKAEREARVAHLSLLEGELSALADEVLATEGGRPDLVAAGVSGELRQRGLKAASDSYMAAHREASAALELLDRTGAAAARLDRMLRLMHAAGEGEIAAKETTVREAEARAVAEAQRVADAAKQKHDAEVAFADEKAKLEAARGAAADPVVRRVLGLKIELADETRLLAADREELARARQDEALVVAARGREELEFFQAAQLIRSRSLSLEELTERRRAVEDGRDRLERDEKVAEARLDAIRAQFDQILERRRTVAAREADLLMPGIPREKLSAAWVVRSMLAKIEERETQIQELRNLRRRIVEVQKARARDLDALTEALRSEIDRIRQARRAAAQAAQAVREGATLERLMAFFDDLTRGIAAGEPYRVRDRVLERAARIARRRSPWIPLLAMTLVGALLYLFTVRVLRTVAEARGEADRQADAYDAMHGEGAGAGGPSPGQAVRG